MNQPDSTSAIAKRTKVSFVMTDTTKETRSSGNFGFIRTLGIFWIHFLLIRPRNKKTEISHSFSFSFLNDQMSYARSRQLFYYSIIRMDGRKENKTLTLLCLDQKISAKWVAIKCERNENLSSYLRSPNLTTIIYNPTKWSL